MTSVTPIRPSQFVMRNGPGSLVPTVEGAILIPQLSILVNQLLHTSYGKDNFNQPDADGKTSLSKFVIPDGRMERMLRHFNSKDKPFESDIKIFKLPTNVDLRIKETRNILSGFVFPRWGICTQHKGYSILMKFSEKSFDEIILDCPKCRNQGFIPRRGVPVKFVQACPNGHLQDVYWPSLVHGNDRCGNQIFEWRDVGGDNFIIKCIKCNMKTDYVGKDGLKTRSIGGRLKCDGQFPEREIKFNPNNSCEKKLNNKGNLVSPAKLVLRNSTGLHTPKNLTSVQIPKFSGPLYHSLYPHRTTLNGFVHLVDDWDKNKLVKYLESIKEGNQITNDTMYEVERTQEDELIKAVNNIIDELNADAKQSRQKPISESESNDEELVSLLEAARTGYPPASEIGQKRAYVNIEDIILIESKEFGVTFRISPIRELKVIKTQVGYSREIGSIGDLDSTQSRIGKLVRKSCYYEDGNTRWYLGDENFGEGLFIDIVKSKIDEVGGLNPVDNSSSEEIDTWSSIRDKLNDLLGSTEDEELKQEVTNTNPRFVWWHTLCHKLLLNLCVDSGFSIVSFGERVYCKKDKHDGTYQSGILMYTSATGSDGTLGGLVGLAKKEFMSELFKKTAQGIISCSNDPVCSERKIALDKREGACCHACELLSETTCDYQNRNLDRNLVMETMP